MVPIELFQTPARHVALALPSVPSTLTTNVHGSAESSSTAMLQNRSAVASGGYSSAIQHWSSWRSDAQPGSVTPACTRAGVPSRPWAR